MYISFTLNHQGAGLCRPFTTLVANFFILPLLPKCFQISKYPQPSNQSTCTHLLVQGPNHSHLHFGSCTPPHTCKKQFPMHYVQVSCALEALKKVPRPQEFMHKPSSKGAEGRGVFYFWFMIRSGPIPEVLQYRANPWPGRSKPLFHGLGSKISLIYKRLGESRFRY